MANSNNSNKTTVSKNQHKFNSRNKRSGKYASNCDVASDSKRTKTSKDVEYNDPSWRTYNDILTQSAAQFTFNQFVGTPIKFGVSANMGAVGSDLTLSPIMKVEVNPSASLATDIRSPINQCALKLYTTLSANNAKTTAYAPQDVICALLAIGELVSNATHIMRVIGSAMVTNPRNRMYPIRIIEAMGINAEDLFANLDLYRVRYNILAARASAIAFPANITYFASNAALFDSVFLDSPDPMSQSYVVVPHSTWVIDEMSDTKGTMLQTVDIPARAKLSEVLDIFEDQINALSESSTLNFLYADVLKFAGDNLYRLPTIGGDFVSEPRFSTEFLTQLENCTITGVPISDATNKYKFVVSTAQNNVYSDADHNCIQYAPVFVSPSPLMGMDTLMNYHSALPTMDDRIAGLRFRAVAETVKIAQAGTAASGPNYAYQLTLPDHYVVAVHLVLPDGTDLQQFRDNGVPEGSASPSADNFAAVLTAFSQFRGAPLMYTLTTAANSTEDTTKHWVVNHVQGSIDTYTVLDRQSAKAMAEVSILALYSLR